MEEILASIRRIIADDQPLPPVREPEARGNAAVPEGAPDGHSGIVASAGADEPRADAPPHVELPNPELPETVPAALHPHGHIAAPQFPEMPEGTIAPPLPEEPPEDAALESFDEVDHDVPSTSTVHDHAYDAPRTDHLDHYPAPDAHRGGVDYPHHAPAPEALFSKATDHSVTAAFNALAASRLADNSEELLGIARDMIRPLLKAWIDDNMPSMVERMVRAEIERVARGGR